MNHTQYVVSRFFTTIPSRTTNSKILNIGRHHRNRGLCHETFSRLGQIGRVHAPEADMRPVLPHRDLLFKAVAPILTPTQTPTNMRKEKDPNTSSVLIANLVEQAGRHVEHGDLSSFSSVVRGAIAAVDMVNADVCVRAVTITAVQKLSAQDSSSMEAVMNSLAEEGALELLRTEDVGMVLDVLVRGMLSRRDLVSAFRGELLSRALETRLRRGTYTALIAKSDRIELGLSLFHRALATGIEPNRKMFNTLLSLCFNSGDGNRARAVLAEMASRDICINGETLSILLAQAPCVDSIAAVLDLVQADRSQVRLSPYIAELFIQAFLRSPPNKDDENTGGDVRVTRSFETVDWFFNRGVGVSHRALDQLVLQCSRNGKVEAALRAWREMRRGWLGIPSRRARTALWALLKDRPVLREQLIGPEVDGEEMQLIRRYALRQIDDPDADSLALDSDEVRDQATVLHRWCRRGRVADAMQWIEGRVRERNGRGVDVSLVLAVLSAEEGSGRAKVLDFCLMHLSSGASVCGERSYVVERAVTVVWRWILMGDGEDFENGEKDDPVPAFDGSMDRDELYSCLEQVIRVAPR